jgi:CHAT domain-containing protein
VVEYFLLDDDHYLVFLIPVWEEGREGQSRPVAAHPVSLPVGTLQRVLEGFQDGLTGARLGFAGRYRGEVPAEASALTMAEREAARQATLQAFASLPAQLGQAFIRPWIQALEALRPTALLLVPHGALHLLPLHAALLPDDTPLLERYPLAYLPSASLAPMLVGQQQAAPRPQARLVMGPPLASRPEEDLPIAQIETQELAERWGLSGAGQPYARDRMRVRVLREHAGQLQLVHLATHSIFHHERFLQSSLQFSDERLTLFELLSDAGLNFQGTRLFYLSSCESGRAQIDAADELQGLVWTLMAAGAEAVMASLWPVDDRAAKSMASIFYREWRPGTSPVNAYPRAVQAVRARYANPYYWAPFILCGDGFSPL